jgi:hypothetical protein
MPAQLKVKMKQLAAVMIHIVRTLNFGLESKPSFLSEKHTHCPRSENASLGIAGNFGFLAVCPGRVLFH